MLSGADCTVSVESAEAELCTTEDVEAGMEEVAAVTEAAEKVELLIAAEGEVDAATEEAADEQV